MLWLTGVINRLASGTSSHFEKLLNVAPAQASEPAVTAPDGESVTKPESFSADAVSDECGTEVPWDRLDGKATITDFTPEEESLVFVWDDRAVSEPPQEVTVELDPDKDGELQVWMGSEVLAQVQGQTALKSADIAFIPLSSAEALNLVET